MSESEEEYQKNVLGEKLEECSTNPLTGFFRDGCCNTDTLMEDYILFA